MECWSSAPKESSTKKWATRHAMTHTTQKTTHDTKKDLSGLGLDPQIVIETGENWLSFALGSSQFLKYLQRNFQNLTFTMMLLHNLVKKKLPPLKVKLLWVTLSLQTQITKHKSSYCSKKLQYHYYTNYKKNSLLIFPKSH